MTSELSKWTFLTASRNDSASLVCFLDELRGVLEGAGMLHDSRVFVVDDYSIDDSVDAIAAWCEHHPDLSVDVISAPTNFGNQGAMAYGLRRIDIPETGFLVSFDADGEDDLARIPEMAELAESNPATVVFSERGRRYDRALVRLLFLGYRLLFRHLTGHRVVPNNFMIIPGQHVEAVSRSSLVVAYFGLAVMRLRLPFISLVCDRRERYAGQSSQSVYELMSHAFVGLMVFYETVVARIFSYLVVGVIFFLCASGFALFVKFVKDASLPGWTALFIAVNFGFIIFLGGLSVLIAAFAISFKLMNFYIADFVSRHELGARNRE